MRLMRMAYSKDPRTNQVCKALIGKTILAGQWANGDGILIYVDMIRYGGRNTLSMYAGD